MLTCPVCSSHLDHTGQALVCPRGHAFDLAREGYVNLLRSKHPGDTREMLAARRRFLERGHYAPVAQRVCELAAAHLADAPPPVDSRRRSVLDAGCGDGYYLGAMQTHLRAEAGSDLAYLGIDSSRDACRLAARRYQEICFAVADLKDRIPVAEGSVDLLLNIFAPRNATEFRRVLAVSGLVIVVIPQPHHLQELRSSFPLIGIEENKADHVIRRFHPSLEHIHRESLEYELLLQPQDAVDLIGMSPSHRHLTAPVSAPASTLSVTVAVDLLTFGRGVGASV